MQSKALNYASLTLKSGNVKTGPIPVSTTSREACPDSCSFKKSGCYAKGGPLAIHWQAITEGRRGKPWADFCADIEQLPEGQLWRHNQAGDLLGEGETIDPVALGQLVKANIGKRGFTYTHKTKAPENYQWIKAANDWGFTVNLSAENLTEADKLHALDIGPVATVLPDFHGAEKMQTPAGVPVIVCPATYRDNVSCATCKLCAVSDRKTIIGFPAHGAAKQAVNKVFFMRKG